MSHLVKKLAKRLVRSERACKAVYWAARQKYVDNKKLALWLNETIHQPLPHFFSENSNSASVEELLMLPAPASNAKRSVIFTHPSYYNFYYLAKALRKRGWDALCVNLQSKKGPDNNYFHAFDVELHHDDPGIFLSRMHQLHNIIKSRFKMVHFYGEGVCSVFPDLYSKGIKVIPWDFLELKKMGIKIGYTLTGCNDLASQTSFNKWSGDRCQYCVWRDKPDVCSDNINSQWGHKLERLADLVCLEADPLLDYRKTRKGYLDPLTCALDLDVWREDLEIPEKYKIERQSGEILIYHAVGNFNSRTVNGKNYKGSDIVFSVIESLKQKGHRIKLIFADSVPSIDVRFLQVQADIVVDQLNYGRFGANARECMMLGKPTISRIDYSETRRSPLSTCIKETPIISSDGSDLEAILLKLINNPEERRNIGKASREYAVKWWAADACAERFEKVYDALMRGQSPSRMVL